MIPFSTFFSQIFKANNRPQPNSFIFVNLDIFIQTKLSNFCLSISTLETFWMLF